MKDKGNSVVLIGPFPPPVHGMAKNLKKFAEDVEMMSDIVKLDISPGRIDRSLLYHLVKIHKVAIGLLQLLFLAVLGRVKSIYMPPDAGFGSYYSLCFVVVSRVFNLPIYLHHRSFLYVNKPTLAMRIIVMVQSKKTEHIFLCEKMARDFESIYGKQNKTTVVSNAQYVRPVATVEKSEGALVIGHLSNLGFGKGLRQVFEVCCELRNLNVPFKLELGGPPENKEVEGYVAFMEEVLGESMNYYGLVDASDKDSFYSKLDVFLFPTEYKNEAQPNVIFEANAAAVPVFTVDVGCVGVDVDFKNGFVFENQEDFALKAPAILTYLESNKEALYELRKTTLEKVKVVSSASSKGYEDLLCAVSGEEL